jgi:hypothetical protein
MDFIVYVMWQDLYGTHEEYRQFPILEEAQNYADHKRKRFSEYCEHRAAYGYNVRIYEQVNY